MMATKLSRRQDLLFQLDRVRRDKRVNTFMIIFWKYAKWLVALYIFLCTIHVILMVLNNFIPIGEVLGSILILLFFFLAIPIHILTETEKWVGFHFMPRTWFADMDSFTGYVLLFVHNIVFALLLALILTLISFALKYVQKNIQIK